MDLTVGQRLQRAREELGISIDEAAHETHIRVNYLQELETDHPELLHSTAQARGFLRLYAEFLNLSYEELVAFWEEKPEEPEPPETQPVKNRKKFSPKWLKRDQSDQPEAVELDDSQPQEESPQQEAPVQADRADVEQEAAAQNEELPDNELPGSAPSNEKEASIEEGAHKEAAPLSQPKNFLTNLRDRIIESTPLKKIVRRKDNGGELEEEQPKPEPVQTSEDIFREIGQIMQSRRRMMELNLSDIENFTNLKRAFLISIEEGRFGELPSTVQGRGMLNNYAKFLGMEESAVMDMYGKALQLQRDERQSKQRQAAAPPVSVKINLPEKWRRILNLDLIVGGILIIGLFVFIIWGAVQVFSASDGEPTEAPSISEVLQITATPAVTQAAETPDAETEATDIPGVVIAQSTPTTVATVNAAPLQLYIITHDRAFVDIVVDGEETFRGRVSPENVYTYSGNDSISLLTGNAAALEIYFNQEYLGKLGGIGEVVDIDFTLAGLFTSTPQPAGTPTPTLEAPAEDAMDTAEDMTAAE